MTMLFGPGQDGIREGDGARLAPLRTGDAPPVAVPRHFILSSATAWLAAGILIVGLAEWQFGGSLSRVVDVGGLVPARVRGGEWWRLLTATWLHASASHLFNNMFALLLIGSTLEPALDRGRLMIVYAVSGAAGALCSLWLLGLPSIGASGAIMGWAGFAIVAIAYGGGAAAEIVLMLGMDRLHAASTRDLERMAVIAGELRRSLTETSQRFAQRLGPSALPVGGGG